MQIEQIVEEVQNNFDDMDFENADKKDEMDDIVQEIKKKSEDMRTRLNELSFEE